MQGRALQYFAELHGLVDSAIQGRVFGGAVFFVKREGDWILHHAKGHLGSAPERAPLEKDVIFDVASLTKVLVTTPSVMLLQEVGELSIDDPVANYLPAFYGGKRSFVTLRDLLTHSSGLPAWAPIYLFADTKDAVSYTHLRAHET